MTVSTVSASQVNFTKAITKSFDGTTASNQHVFINRVPQYKDVTIDSGGSITTDGFETDKTGIIAFLATGTVKIGGSGINNKGGYRGGVSDGGDPDGSCHEKKQGESRSGTGTNSTSANGGAGGGGAKMFAGTGTGGGGASYGTLGTAGTIANNARGCVGGSAGNIYGKAALPQLFLGSGGGASYGDGTPTSSAGGRGGGIIFIKANRIELSGPMIASGRDGVGHRDWNGAGGAGSGGSIYLVANSATLGENLVTATGGIGAIGAANNGNNGGNGGSGRIRVEYTESFSGNTNPPASSIQLGL